jgi:hypothetical protein
MADYEDRPLIEYLPNILKEVREYQALMFGEQPEIFGLFIEIENALNNQFVASSMEYGIERWEKILNIAPKATFTLDERKFTILSRLSEQLPFTCQMLIQMLTQLCGANGFHVLLQHNDYILNVSVELTVVNNFNGVGTMLKKVVPANMVVNLTIKYNQYQTFKPFTHGQLAQRTHSQLRNEAL